MRKNWHVGPPRVSPKSGLKFITPKVGVALKPVSGAPAKRLGVAPGSVYVPEGTKRITKATLFVSNTQAKIARTAQRIGEKISLKQAAERRRTGELSYKTAAAKQQSAKQMFTRQRRRVTRRLRSLTRVHSYDGKRLDRINDAAKQRYWELRERKLRGEWLNDGDFHEMFKVALEIEDGATIDHLKESPDTKGAEDHGEAA